MNAMTTAIMRHVLWFNSMTFPLITRIWMGLLVGYLSLSVDVHAIKPNGMVIRVVDGDTIHVRDTAGDRKKIRLWGIDAPEIRQKNGALSGRFLAARIGGEPIHIQIVDTDRYGRLVANVYDQDGVYLNEQMVQLGLAWVYPQYVNKTVAHWFDLQEAARRQGIGLWKEDGPTPPWVYRKTSKKK